MYSLRFESAFVKRYGKLSSGERKAVDSKLRLLSGDPWHPSLRVKKIKATNDVFECSVNIDIRIAFIFDGDTIIILLDVGHHDKLLNRQTRK